MTKKRKLFWQLYPWFLAITFLSVAALVWFAAIAVKETYLESAHDDLEIRARLIEDVVKEWFAETHADKLDRLCKELGRSTATRITLVLPSGKVIGDSHADPARMEDHSLRPELKDALSGKAAVLQRYSFTLNQEMIYAARPILDQGRVIGVVRVAVPIKQIAGLLDRVYFQMIAGSLIIAVVAALVSLYVARRIERPIIRLQDGVIRFSGGNLDYRLEIPRTEEVAALAEAMNAMAAQLHSRIVTVTSQRNELEAILSSMMEAVIVVDATDRVMRTNKAAERLFAKPAHHMEGRSIREVIRNTDFHRFVEKTHATDEPVEGEIVFLSGEERFIQAHGTSLRDTLGKKIGALVVLNDVTRLKKLETIRRDFVTNVSHELKTPITSIQGFLETLKDGAIDDPENRGRFLGIILKHTNRLSMIIEDLLSLSKLEQAEQKDMELHDVRLAGVLESVIKTCKHAAEQKNIAFKVECDKDLFGKVNPVLLEQAVLNLVDNAIKYSGPGSVVALVARKSNGESIISVTDQGCGISREHLDRIFERFYRVDKARSREAGGTGLGLAIAKHIVNAHGGRIEVQSSPGEGSTFSIRLGDPKE